MEFINRFRWPYAQYLWLLWLAFVLFLTVDPFWWHVQYFSSPGPQYYRLILGVIPGLAVAAFAYGLLRKRGLWRHEPLLFGAALLAGCLFYEPRSTVVILALWASAYAIGKFCLDRLGVVTESHAADISLCSAVGLALLTVAMFLLGLAGAYYFAVLAALVLVPCLVFFRRLKQLPLALREALDTWRGDPELTRLPVGLAVAFAAVFMVCTMMLMLVPTINADSILFHFAEVGHYAEIHGLEPVPAMPYSYFPQGGEVLMTLAYILGGQAAAQMVNPLFFFLSILLLYALARHLKISRAATVMGLVAAASIPFLHWTGSSFKNDFLLALYQMGSLYCFLRNREQRRDHWIYIGVFLLASSFGVKHTAVFGAIPLGLLYLTITWRRPRLLAICFLIGLTFGFHWHARTYQLTGNPLYPRAAKDAGERVLPRQGARRSTAVLYLTYPWVIHFQGKKSFESPSDNPCGIFLVLFAPVALWVRRKRWNAAELICVFAVLLHLAYLGYVWLIIRYALVPFCILAMLTANRLMNFYESSGRLVKGSLLGAVAYSFLFALLPTMITEINSPQLLYFAGRLDGEQYLEKTMRYQPSIRYLWDSVPHDAVILSINNSARGYAPSPSRFHFVAARGRTQNVVRTTYSYMSKYDYDYAVVPTMMSRIFREMVADRYEAEAEHTDPEYTVFRLRGIADTEDGQVSATPG